MILLNDFFSIVRKEKNSEGIRISILLNENHPIYMGHFPDNPVVPGVFMVQMMIELMQETSGKSLMLNGADNIKFLSVIQPEKIKELEVSISYKTESGAYAIDASLLAGEVIFFKLKARLIFA